LVCDFDVLLYLKDDFLGKIGNLVFFLKIKDIVSSQSQGLVVQFPQIVFQVVDVAFLYYDNLSIVKHFEFLNSGEIT